MNRRTPLSYLTLLLAVVISVLWLSPFILALFTSLKDATEAATSSVFAPPHHPTFGAYAEYWSMIDFPQKLRNSFFVAFGATALSMLIGFFNAFALGVGRVKHRTWVLALALIVFAIPQEAMVYPMFQVALKFDIYNSFPPLIIVLGVLYAGFTTFLLAEVMGYVPKEIIEAARIDGARTRDLIFRILVPVLRPTLIVVALLVFIWDWNEYMMPLILLPDNAMQTVAMAVGYTWGGAGFDAYNLVTLRAAGALLTAAPSLMFFFWFQRRINRGFLYGTTTSSSWVDPRMAKVRAVMAEVFGRIVAWGVLAYAMKRGVGDYVDRIRNTGGEIWRSGDWLINYTGGFVRRGMIGQLVLDTSASNQAATLWRLFSVQIACYAIVLLYVIRFLQRERYSWPAVAIACSPAALPFMGWDPQGGFRKEIIGFALLALLGWNARRSGPRWLQYARLALAMAMFVVAVFSWETSAFFLPIALWLLYMADDLKRTVRIGSAAFLTFVSVAGLFLAIKFHGDFDHVMSMCAPLLDRGFDYSYCTDNSAIAAIGWTLKDNMLSVLHSFPLYYWYLPMVFLAVLPFGGVAWIRENRWKVLVAVAPLTLLYIIGIDYGRWTHIWFMALAILLMAQRTTLSRRWNVVTVIAYVALWALPHCVGVAWNLPWPWLGLVHTL